MKLLGLISALLVIAAASAQRRPPLAWRGPGRGGMPIPIHRDGGGPPGPGPHQFAHRRIQNHGPPPKFRPRPPLKRRPPPPGYMRPPMYGAPQQYPPQPFQGTKMSPPGQVVLPPLHPNTDGVSINVPPAPSTSSPLPSPPNYQNQNNGQQQSNSNQQQGQRQQPENKQQKDSEISASAPVPTVVKPETQQQQPIIQLHLGGQGQGGQGQQSVIQIHYSSTPSPVSVKEYYSGSTHRPQTTERPVSFQNVGYRPQDKTPTTTVPPVFRYKDGENNGQYPLNIGPRPVQGQQQVQNQGQAQGQQFNGNQGYPQPQKPQSYGESQGHKPNQEPTPIFGQPQDQGQPNGFRPPQIQGQFQDPVKDPKYTQNLNTGNLHGQNQAHNYENQQRNQDQRPHQHQPQSLGYGPPQSLPHHPQHQSTDNSVKRVHERPVIYKQSEEMVGKTAYTSAEFGQAQKSHYNKAHHYKSEYPDILTAPNPKPFESSEEVRRDDFFTLSKYSQPDPLYHPHGDVVEAEELSVPSRYDNSFSNTYRDEKPPRRQPLPKPNPEDILSALGLSTNPLDHPDIQKAASEKLSDVWAQVDRHQTVNYEPLDLVEYLRKKAELEEQDEPRKEPLYSTPDRPVYEDDVSAEAYPGTGYKMDDAASKVYTSKRPAPESLTGGRAHHSPGSSHDNHDFNSKEHNSAEYRPPAPHRHRPRDPPRDPPPHHSRDRDQPPHPRDPIPHRPQERDQPPHPHDPRDPPPHEHGYGAPSHRQEHYATPPPYPIYVTEPEPIIEIIVQDSNVTLPPRPTMRPTLPPPTTPEPVHVFYVRYSSNNKSNNGVVLGDYGGGPHFAESGQSLNLERPIPALSVRSPSDSHHAPSSHVAHNPQPTNHYNGPARVLQQQQQQQNQQHIQHQPQPQQHQHQPQHHQHQQFQPTTMRALIRPNTNEYESSHLKVAFDRNAQPFSNYAPPQNQNHGYDQQPQGSINVGTVVQQQLAPHEPQQNPASDHSGHAIAHQQYNPAPQQNHLPPAAPSSISFQQLHLHPEPPKTQQNPQHLNHHQPQQHNMPQNNQHQQPFPIQQQHVPQPHFVQHQPQHHIPQQQQAPQQQQQNIPQQQHHVPQQQQQHYAQPQQQQLPQQQPPQQHQPQHPPQQHQQQQQYIPQPQQTAPVQVPEVDLSLDPIWTNWSSQQNDQQNAGSNQQPTIQASNSFNFPQTAPPVLPSQQNFPPVQMPQPLPPQAPPQSPPPQQPQPNHLPYNNGGGQPLGLTGYHAIGTENSMSRESTVGLRPPPGPIYPGFQKRMGLDDLASLLADESTGAVEQQQFPEEQLQHTATYHQEGGGVDLSAVYGVQQPQQPQPQPHDYQNPVQQQYQDVEGAQSQLYPEQVQFDPQQFQSQSSPQSQLPYQPQPSQQSQQYQPQPSQQSQLQYQAQPSQAPVLQYQQPQSPQQPLQFQTQQSQQFLTQQQPSPQTQASQQTGEFKLPDDVPEDLKQQLLSSGILGNAEVQVVNFDQNLFKELGDLPAEALAALQQQPSELTPSWNGSPVSLLSNGDLSSLLGHTRPVRSVIVVERLKKDRPKRGGNRDQFVLYLTDSEAVLYSNKTKKLFGVKRENAIVQRAIEYSHHKAE